MIITSHHMKLQLQYVAPYYQVIMAKETEIIITGHDCIFWLIILHAEWFLTSTASGRKNKY